MSTPIWSPVHLHRVTGSAPFVLLCEHASSNIPSEFNRLGINEATAKSHAAWDIGALDVAISLSEQLDAPLVAGGVSRLLYDCNRPLEAPDAMPEKSEIFAIPGNINLTEQQKDMRHSLIHDPFHNMADHVIRSQKERVGDGLTILTIHSFTPIYHGGQRDVEIGFLFDTSAAFSNAMQKTELAAQTFKTALNEPYDATDGVTYSLRKHAEDNGLDSTMIEIRNDLINTKETAVTMANHLTRSILQSHQDLQRERQVST